MKETRIFAAPVEVRGTADDTATIVGYAAVFNEPYDVMGFTESVDPKAFNKSLRERKDQAVVWSHDADRVLATRESKTARFEVDDHGLRYEADLDLLDPDGISAYRKITTGKVRQSSFSFEVVKETWDEQEDKPPHRTLKEVKLWEASPVMWGANPTTQVDIKRAVSAYAEHRGVQAQDADTIATIRTATTTEPHEPHEGHSVTQEPEPHEAPYFPGL